MTAVHLYAGPDMDSALERTQLSSWLRERSAPSSLRLPAALESLLLDVMNKPTTRLRPTAAIVTGRERTSGATMRILFQGQLRSVDFCAEHILGSADFEVAPVSRPPYPACDIAVIEPPPQPTPTPTPPPLKTEVKVSPFTVETDIAIADVS